MCINSCVRWRGTAVSPLCFLYNISLQQKAPDLKKKHIIEQNNILRELKKYENSISYKRPLINTKVPVSVVVLPEGSLIDENGQLGILTCLSVEEMEEGSICHVFSRIYYKSKRHVK